MMDNLRLISAAVASVALELLIYGTAAHSQADCEALSGQEGVLSGTFIPDDKWQSADLPSVGDVDQALAELDSNEGSRVYAIDLNGDHKPESLLTSGEILCGTGGCPYVLLAGASRKRIGTFFGHLAILDERINGYRIIQSYSRYRAMATTLDTHVFDGKAYRLVSHVILEPCGFEQWGRGFRK